MRVTMMLAAVVAMVAAPQAMAQANDWREIGNFGTGQGEFFGYIDVGSVKRITADEREFSVATHYRLPRSFKSSGRAYTRIETLYRVDCVERSYWTVGSSAYDGETYLLSSTTVSARQPIAPNTMSGEVVDEVCSGQFGGLKPIDAATPNLAGKARYGQP